MEIALSRRACPDITRLTRRQHNSKSKRHHPLRDLKQGADHSTPCGCIVQHNPPQFLLCGVAYRWLYGGQPQFASFFTAMPGDREGTTPAPIFLALFFSIISFIYMVHCVTLAVSIICRLFATRVAAITLAWGVPRHSSVLWVSRKTTSTTVVPCCVLFSATYQ